MSEMKVSDLRRIVEYAEKNGFKTVHSYVNGVTGLNLRLVSTSAKVIFNFKGKKMTTKRVDTGELDL